MNIRDFIMKFNVLYVRNKMVNHISLRDGPKTTMQSADLFPHFSVVFGGKSAEYI